MSKKKQEVHPIDFKKTIVNGQPIVVKVYSEPKRKKQITAK